MITRVEVSVAGRGNMLRGWPIPESPVDEAVSRQIAVPRVKL